MKTSTVLFFLCLFASCSKIKDFEKTTQNMDRTTTALSAKTDGLSDTTTTMYMQIRSKETEETRERKMREILDENQPQTVGMGTKLENAAVYFESFEFQLWTDNKADDLEARYHMFLDAANEFTRRLHDIYEVVKNKNIDPTADYQSHKEEMAFIALATTMHMNHAFQDALSLTHNVREYSFYELIKESFRKDKAGLPLKPYQEILMTLNNKEMLLDLVKTRMNMLTALGLNEVTSKEHLSAAQTLHSGLFLISGGRWGRIDLKQRYPEANAATKNKMITYLDGALKVKKFLAEMEIENKLQKKLRSALENLDLGSEDSKDPFRAQVKSLVDQLTDKEPLKN